MLTLLLLSMLILSNSITSLYNPVYAAPVNLLNDGFESVIWDSNWASNDWYPSTYERSGSISAAALNGKEGLLTTDSLDASDASSITVDFWFRKLATDSTDLTVYYYDGSSYVLIDELDNDGGDYPTWLHYTHTTSDSRYFKSNFRLRIDATLGSGEQAWIDDVSITIEEDEPSVQYDLTLNIVGQGSIDLSAPGPYPDGNVVTLTAVPDPGWEFTGWGGALISQDDTNPASLVMSQNRWVQATFVESSSDTYTLTTATSGQGSIDLSSSGPYEDGTIVTLTAVPDSGWLFSGWSGAYQEVLTQPALL